MRCVFACLLSFALSFSIVASTDTPHWSLDGVTSGWNAPLLVTSYFHHSELQRQWARELIGKQSFCGDEKMLDFGCGDGKISAEMCRLVPRGSVTGVDISSEMLQFAERKFPRYAYANLDFQKSSSLTFDDIPISQSYDVICSFCVFHQVANSLDLLKNLKKHLKQTGKLMLVVPAGKNPAFFEAAKEMFFQYQLKTPWKDKPSVTDLNMRTVEGCFTLLKDAGYKTLSLEMIDTDNPFYDKNELIAWMIGTSPNL